MTSNCLILKKPARWKMLRILFKLILFLFHIVILQPYVKQGSQLVFQCCRDICILVTFNTFLVQYVITYLSFNRKTGLEILALPATYTSFHTSACGPSGIPTSVCCIEDHFTDPLHSHSHKMLTELQQELGMNC